jgi:glycosyltransferase involved in cell wall biosynthesis
MRRLWLLSEQSWRTVRLGPLERMLAFARLGQETGLEPHLALGGGIAAPPEDNITLEQLHPRILSRIAPGDAVITSIFLPPRMLLALLDSQIPFHADFYCVSALEGMESASGLSRLRLLQGRNRTVARYRMFAQRAETLYFSNTSQMEFVGGTIFSSHREAHHAWVSRLPERCVVAPMGVRAEPFLTGAPNPYPDTIQGRPVFLWGGGIWHWFDVPTLLESFRILQERHEPAALFFLVDCNPSGEPTQDSAPRKAIAHAQELGLLGKSVFFHSGAVLPEHLPAYLEHCTAGILSNASNLEAHASWRTRYLDLIWAGKPILVNRSDTLAQRLESEGAAQIHHPGDATGLADKISNLTKDSKLRSRLSERAVDLRVKYATTRTLEPIRDLLTTDAWTTPGSKTTLVEKLFYLLGL